MCDRELGAGNGVVELVGLDGQGHHICVTSRGPSLFLIVILTMLFLCLGCACMRGDFIIQTAGGWVVRGVSSGRGGGGVAWSAFNSV